MTTKNNISPITRRLYSAGAARPVKLANTGRTVNPSVFMSGLPEKGHPKGFINSIQDTYCIQANSEKEREKR